MRRAIWFMTLDSTLLDPGVPSWIWIRRINSASDNSDTSFLDNLLRDSNYFSPTPNRTTHLWLDVHSCSEISNSIFALTVATLILLNSFTIFFFLRDFRHKKTSLQFKLSLNLLEIFFPTHSFPSNITKRLHNYILRYSINSLSLPKPWSNG